ncbi:MAG: hypothetical protein J4469_04135 [Candidatus Aenigmarchaeota archaeon]|nr:hypothetical protein [Candidatus Aenigmarchaeota archaeon]
MKSNWDLKLIAQFAGVAVLAGFITIALPYIGKERKVEAQKPQQKRYVISRPERCAEIVNGGVGQLTNSGSPVEYILCETPDGNSMFYRYLDDRDRTVTSWTEHQYRK